MNLLGFINKLIMYFEPSCHNIKYRDHQFDKSHYNNIQDDDSQSTLCFRTCFSFSK